MAGPDCVALDSALDSMYSYSPAAKSARASSGPVLASPRYERAREMRAVTNPLAEKDLTDFIKIYKAPGRSGREETDRFKKFTYDEIIDPVKANLDIFWLKIRFTIAFFAADFRRF